MTTSRERYSFINEQNEITFTLNYEADSAPMKVTKDFRCNSTYDCFDFRMICLRNRSCGCAKFHDWENYTQRCVANISKIFQWLRATMSTEPEAVFQQEDFKVVESEGVTILQPNWAEYEGIRETGISHITRVIWPILLGVLLIFIVYGAILLEFF